MVCHLNNNDISISTYLMSLSRVLITGISTDSRYWNWYPCIPAHYNHVSPHALHFAAIDSHN